MFLFIKVSSCAQVAWKTFLFIQLRSYSANLFSVQFSSVAVVSDCLQPNEPQHARPPCPSPTPGFHPNPHPLSRWCHLTISSSVVPFSSCHQSFPASGSFPMSQLFALGGQSIGVLASTSILPMHTQDSSPLGWTGWISLQSKGLSRVFSNTTVQKHQFFCSQLSSQSNSHIHTGPLEKPVYIMSLFHNMLYRLFITFLPRSKCLLISWLHSPSAVILKPRKIKPAIYLPWSDGTGCHDLSLMNAEL